MSNQRLIIKTAELTNDGILIRSVDVIEADSGKVVKAAKLNEHLLNLIKVIEIDINTFFELEELKKENQNVKKLIDTFKLYT